MGGHLSPVVPGDSQDFRDAVGEHEVKAKQESICSVGELETSRTKRSPGSVLEPVPAGAHVQDPLQPRREGGEMTHGCTYHLTQGHLPGLPGSPATPTIQAAAGAWWPLPSWVADGTFGAGAWNVPDWCLALLCPWAGCGPFAVTEEAWGTQQGPWAQWPAGWVELVHLLKIASLPHTALLG